MKKRKLDFTQDFFEELEDPRSAEAYLNDAMKSREASVILMALRDLAKVRGIADVAKKSGIQREHLYTILSEKGNPTLESFNAIMNALGYELQVRKKASGS